MTVAGAVEASLEWTRESALRDWTLLDLAQWIVFADNENPAPKGSRMDADSVTRHQRARGAQCSPAPPARATCIRFGAPSLVLLLTFALVGCDSDGSRAESTAPTSSASSVSSSSTDPSSSPTSATPTTSPEKAVTQAEEQLRAFYRANDELLSDPTVPLHVLNRYASSKALQDNQDVARSFREKGWVLTGRARLFHLRPGHVRVVPNGVTTVEMRVCYDLRKAPILDGAGNEVSPNSPKIAAARYLMVTKRWPLNGPDQWRVDRQEVHGDPCPM